MNQSVKIAICFILFAVISVIIYFLIKIRKQSNKNRDKFISYLESKNDYVNLIKFGFYNTSGFRENRRVPFLDNIILDEYKFLYLKIDKLQENVIKYDEYKNMNQDELNQALFSEVAKQKANGNFNYSELEKMVNSLQGMLPANDFENVRNLLNKLK